MRVYIIEDDLSTAINYEVLFNECGIKECTVYNEIETAKENILANPPDIAILDLYLNQEISLELLPILNAANSETIVVTGFPKTEFVEKAIDFEVVTFLPKPVSPHALKFQILASMKKCTARKNDSFCYVKSKNKYERLPYADIQLLETEGNYTSIFTSSVKYILKRSLKNVYSELPSDIFTRVHRNYVINNNRVKNIDMKNNQIEMLDNTIVQIGGKYRNDIKKAIGSKFNII